jgi:hypothetical protein
MIKNVPFEFEKGFKNVVNTIQDAKKNSWYNFFMKVKLI